MDNADKDIAGLEKEQEYLQKKLQEVENGLKDVLNVARE